MSSLVSITVQLVAFGGGAAAGAAAFSKLKYAPFMQVLAGMAFGCAILLTISSFISALTELPKAIDAAELVLAKVSKYFQIQKPPPNWGEARVEAKPPPPAQVEIQPLPKTEVVLVPAPTSSSIQNQPARWVPDDKARTRPRRWTPPDESASTSQPPKARPKRWIPPAEPYVDWRNTRWAEQPDSESKPGPYQWH